MEVCDGRGDGAGLWTSLGKQVPIPANAESQRGDDLTLRLAPDDVPIEGRILTAEGRPVAGERIRAFTVTYSQNAAGIHIPWDSKEPAKGPRKMRLGNLVANATTDADGRFHMTGLGRDRLVSLWMNGPQVAQQEIRVQTRKVPPPSRWRSQWMAGRRCGPCTVLHSSTSPSRRGRSTVSCASEAPASPSPVPWPIR